MRGPQPPCIDLDLTPGARLALEALMRRQTTPQHLALRARIILAAAAGANNAQIARDLRVSVDMVRRWRERWRAGQATTLADLPLVDRLHDAPRSGAPARITADQVAQIVALACAAPAESGRPITHWTSREVADEIKQRGIVAQISGRHAARLLQRGRSNRT